VTYVSALARRLGDSARVGAPVRGLVRHERGVTVRLADGTSAEHDAAVVATHADQALALLADPTPRERDALRRFRYSTNETWLHSDESLMPAAPAARAAWNCDLADCRVLDSPVAVTYDLNRLQGHRPGRPLLCSLNPVSRIDGEVLARMSYTHPILDGPAIEGQALVGRLNGERRTWFCGAHLRYGFHEDGVVSAVAAARGLGVDF
jgi:predicted NAD/FAD-binding protein